MAALSLLTACNNGLDIDQVYGFELETMPVQKRVAKNETVEIRCRLIRQGEYKQARYYIRYFQPDGLGRLWMMDGTVFVPNDRYPLTNETFRLYYTSKCEDQQTIDIYIEDNFGQVVQKTLSWQNQ